VFDVANVAIVLGFVLLIRRYRRSDQSTRQQIRWLLLPLVAAVLALTAELLLNPGHVGQLGAVVTSAALGVGIGFGIVRPEGVRADDVLRRSVMWGIVWLGIASVFVAVSAGFGVTVGQRLSVGWTVTMTVVAMIALQPVRSTLERIANHRLFGTPPDPRKAIARLGDSLAGTYDLETLLPEIAAALEEGLGVEWARVRLSPDDGVGDRVPELVEPIVFDGEELGVVECGPKRTGSFDQDDAAVVATFARQAALAVRNVKLTTNLSERTAELAASRARLLRVEEAERRRIERDIHDGVQQGLVALIGQIGLLRRRARRGGTEQQDLVGDLDLLRTGLQRLLVELRELAAGIHPSVLRDRGLLAAVETLAARHPVVVEVRADPELRDLRLPIEVESAGYYTVAEALANSLKHAGASRLTIELAYADHAVRICVGDDGSGFDPEQVVRNGLTNLAERIDAVEGRFAVDTQTGRGTRVTAQLPVGAQHT
jgi:signal transduction histidine kinase